MFPNIFHEIYTESNNQNFLVYLKNYNALQLLRVPEEQELDVKFEADPASVREEFDNNPVA